jgi:hypothetical protein
MATLHNNENDPKVKMTQPNTNNANPIPTSTGRRQMLLKAAGLATIPVVMTVKAQRTLAGPGGTMPSPMSKRP